MAFYEFYIQTTGNNLNSGTSSADTAPVIVTGGTWGGGSGGTFTAASGTPFSGVSAGDYASLYPDGTSSATGFSRLGKISTVNGGGSSITFTASGGLGNIPAASGGYSCRVGGAWASPAMFAVAGGGAATEAMRFNFKAGTYSTAVGSVTWNYQGTNAFPVWLRGYRTSPGDLDNDTTSQLVAGTDFPTITVATASNITGAIYNTMSFVAIKTAHTAQAFTAPASTGCSRYYRCRFENTNNVSGAYAASTGIQNTFIRCSFTAPALSGGVVRYVNPSPANLLDCVISGGAIGVLQPSTSQVLAHGNLITGFTTTGFSQSTANSNGYYSQNTINGSASTNGFLFTSITTGVVPMVGNYVSNCTNWAGATAVNGFVKLVMCGGYNYSTRVVSMNADDPVIGFVLDTASPYMSSSVLVPNMQGMGGDAYGVVAGTSLCSSHILGAVRRNPLVGFRR